MSFEVLDDPRKMKGESLTVSTVQLKTSNNIAVSTIAVSYTHLDVYKRQLYNTADCL